MLPWIWDAQIRYFAEHFHVVALDPRSQGDSDKPSSGNYPERRAQDINELIEHLKLSPVVLVGCKTGLTQTESAIDSAPGKAGSWSTKVPRRSAGDEARVLGQMNPVAYRRGMWRAAESQA
jgi:pimeloyl-ACP methyl ester carboxylesterase